ncbi:MAG: T9SS type A sorting domain-containing protein [Sphingobacteriales bacterium]|nr:MAG: T9SS type A sorting domain-containing protein [Sphingobacteriales bacterium]
MKYLFPLLIITLLAGSFRAAEAQVVNQGNMYIPPDGEAAAFGDLLITDTATVHNAGNLYALNNITNLGETGYDGGTLTLAGQNLQTLNGNAIFFTSNLVIDNSGGGVSMRKRYSVSQVANFVSGIVDVPFTQEPLEFNPGGNTGNAVPATGASDQSHVEGYVLQLGKGAFTFPLGDGIRYQPISVQLKTNNGGLRGRYIPGDAGGAPYLNSGLSSTPLLRYNTLEYWDLLPLGNAVGRVTIHYDTYRDFGIGADYSNALKVAHKQNGGWTNDGGIVSGDINEGTVTTEGDISNWNRFTLGSVTTISPLPNDVLDFMATQDNCDVLISWNSAVENGLFAYEVQYSTDGVRFKTVGTLPATGNGSFYQYRFTPMNGRVYFRLLLRGLNGEQVFTKMLVFNMNCTGNAHSATVYPNPVTMGNDLHVNLLGFRGKITGMVYDVAGRRIFVTALENGNNNVAVRDLAVGTYQLIIYSDDEREVYRIVVTN